MTTTITCPAEAIHLAPAQPDAEILVWTPYDATRGVFHPDLITCWENNQHDVVYEWGYRTVKLPSGHEHHAYAVRRFTRKDGHAVIDITAPINLPPSKAFTAAAHQWLALLAGRAI